MMTDQEQPEPTAGPLPEKASEDPFKPIANTETAKVNGSPQPGKSPGRRVLDPKDPLSTARRIVAESYTRDRVRTLHHHSGLFHEWDGAAFEPADDATIRSRIYEYLETAVAWDANRERETPFKPTSAKVSDVADALRAAANLPRSIQAPAWLPGAPASAPPANELLACRNGILHLPSYNLEPPSPLLWTHTGLPFDFDPDAPEPREWLRFLASIWPDDDEAINTLQELFGHLLTADTSLQKLFLIVGPKRSGKGTIARVLTALLGRNNVAAPTLAALGQNFGLAPLIGKSLALISDARLSARADQAAIAERLLSISGEDSLTIDRKYREPWTGQLGVRFVIMTNELPRLADASGALASRFIILTMQRSFYGHEDPGLTTRLLKELPGILNWAIDGWQRLEERGHLVQPESSREATEELEDLGSPVNAFIKECCIVAPGEETAVGDLFAAWRRWCEDHGREHPGTQQSFGRDLKAAVPGIRGGQRRDIHGKPYRLYHGIGLQ